MTNKKTYSIHRTTSHRWLRCPKRGTGILWCFYYLSHGTAANRINAPSNGVHFLKMKQDRPHFTPYDLWTAFFICSCPCCWILLRIIHWILADVVPIAPTCQRSGALYLGAVCVALEFALIGQHLTRPALKDQV